MRLKDILLILYIPFFAIGFLIGSIFKAAWAGAALADKFSEWGAKR